MVLAFLRLGHDVSRKNHRVLVAKGLAQAGQSLIAFDREGSGGVEATGRDRHR
jgi:hypothetical protein